MRTGKSKQGQLPKRGKPSSGRPRNRQNASARLRLLCAWAIIMVPALGWPTAHLFGSTASTAVIDHEETFFEANQAYKAERYQEALAGYRKLLDAGYRSGHLYYNLGNAHLRQGEIGRAILAYERARILMPRDADLLFNLRYASDQRQDEVHEEKSLAATAFFWLDSLSMKELLWTFAALNGVFWFILFLRLFNRSDLSYYLLLTVGILWAMGGISFGLKGYQAETDDRAVVLPKEASIFAGPDERETVLFKLHSGTLVHQERPEDGWALVRLSGDRRGWTKGGHVERIRPDG